MNSENFYNGKLYSIEKLTLAEDVIFTDFKPITGKFFTDIISPANELGSETAKVVNRGKYSKSNFVILDIPPSVLVNCVKPKIRTLYVDAEGNVNIHNGRPIRVFAMGFENANSVGYKIPKGTEFLVEFIGGSTSIADYRILGTSEANPKVVEV